MALGTESCTKFKRTAGNNESRIRTSSKTNSAFTEAPQGTPKNSAFLEVPRDTLGSIQHPLRLPKALQGLLHSPRVSVDGRLDFGACDAEPARTRSSRDPEMGSAHRRALVADTGCLAGPAQRGFIANLSCVARPLGSGRTGAGPRKDWDGLLDHFVSGGRVVTRGDSAMRAECLSRRQARTVPARPAA